MRVGSTIKALAKYSTVLQSLTVVLACQARLSQDYPALHDIQGDVRDTTLCWLRDLMLHVSDLQAWL